MSFACGAAEMAPSWTRQHGAPSSSSVRLIGEGLASVDATREARGRARDPEGAPRDHGRRTNGSSARRTSRGRSRCSCSGLGDRSRLSSRSRRSCPCPCGVAVFTCRSGRAQYPGPKTSAQRAGRTGLLVRSAKRPDARSWHPVRSSTPSPNQSNDRPPAARTTKADEAVRYYSAGWSLARIGEQFGVDPTTMLNRLRDRASRPKTHKDQACHVTRRPRWRSVRRPPIPESG